MRADSLDLPWHLACCPSSVMNRAPAPWPRRSSRSCRRCRGIAGAQTSTGATEHRRPRRPTSSTCGARFGTRTQAAEQPAWDYRKAMKAFAPVIGAKPSSGALLGVAGNIAFYRGDPATTRISSVVASLTFSTKGQTALTDRFTMFGRDDRWRLEADHRFQWTSLETAAARHQRRHRRQRARRLRLLPAAPHRVLPAAARPLRRRRPAITTITSTSDRTPTRTTTRRRPSGRRRRSCTTASAHGLPLDAQASAGPSVDLLWDTRDSFINAAHGWLAKASYRTSFDGFLGARLELAAGESRRAHLPPLSRRAAVTRSPAGCSPISIVGGVAPYLDLPGTGLDTYGRSARGYSEGQFRGERLAYGEIEYRGTLMRNGLLGMVAFVNATTISNLRAGRASVRQRRDRRRRRPSPADQQAVEDQPVLRRRRSASRGRGGSTWRSRKRSDPLDPCGVTSAS